MPGISVRPRAVPHMEGPDRIRNQGTGSSVLQDIERILGLRHGYPLGTMRMSSDGAKGIKVWCKSSETGATASQGRLPIYILVLNTSPWTKQEFRIRGAKSAEHETMSSVESREQAEHSER